MQPVRVQPVRERVAPVIFQSEDFDLNLKKSDCSDFVDQTHLTIVPVEFGQDLNCVDLLVEFGQGLNCVDLLVEFGQDLNCVDLLA